MPKTPGDHAFTAESPYGTVAEPTYSGALSFMRRRYTRDLKGVDVAVTGVPLDLATSNRPGARFPESRFTDRLLTVSPSKSPASCRAIPRR